MDGRELASKLNYIGMSRDVRKIALDDKLASIEDLALMTEGEVCDLIAQKYQLVYAENEEIGLVPNDKAKELFDMIKVISR
jgi:hypothetical protein